MTPTQQANAFENARYLEGHARNDLNKIHASDNAIAHAQAEAILAGFVRRIGFKKLADAYENLADERGFSY